MTSRRDFPGSRGDAVLALDRVGDLVGGNAAFPLENETQETATAADVGCDLLLTPDARYARSEPFTSLSGGHETMSSTLGLPASTSESTETSAGVDRAESEHLEAMGDGEKLRQLLDIKRYEQTDLAREAGVSKAAVGKWMKEKKFSDRKWPKIRDGLLKLGLNPSDIRVSPHDQEASEDLTKLVERMSRDQLTVIKRILTSDEVSKSRLLAYIDGALRPFP